MLFSTNHVIVSFPISINFKTWIVMSWLPELLFYCRLPGYPANLADELDFSLESFSGMILLPIRKVSSIMYMNDS